MKIKYFILAFSLLFAVFLAEYGFCAYRWVTPPGIAIVTDRSGEQLIPDKATVHLLGDGAGNIPKTMLSYYAEKAFSYNLLNGIYSYSGGSRRARLTVSAPLQRAALAALGERRGTVAVMNYQTGEILCAVTSPTFDPENRGETVEGMFVNRFIRGRYTPGSIYKLVTLAAALEDDPEIESRVFSCKGEQHFGTDKVTCPKPHGKQTLQEAFRNSCNCAFAALAAELGEEKMTHYADKFGLTAPISFDGFTTASGRYDAKISLPWSGAGQGDTKINPCAFLTFLSAIARDGQGRRPYLMAQIRQGYKIHYRAKPISNAPILSPETAEILRTYLRSNVEKKYGDESFGGLTVCAKTGTAEVGTEMPNALFCGFVLEKDCPIAFLIIAENAGTGTEICLPIARQLFCNGQWIIDN
ncbi:MAG: penicillin-binding protein [Ruminococcaceae bacterium]|nr:penicillin-binding protein [Oscillospiraceae bacterium]